MVIATDDVFRASTHRTLENTLVWLAPFINETRDDLSSLESPARKFILATDFCYEPWNILFPDTLLLRPLHNLFSDV